MTKKNMFFVSDKYDIYCIYKENNSLVFKSSHKSIVVSNSVDMVFNCVADENDIIYILFRDLNGEVILARYNKDNIDIRSMFKRMINTYFYFDIVKNIPVILYTVFDNFNRCYKLMYMSLEDSKWSEEKFIDNIIINSNLSFGVSKVSNNHKILYYKNLRGSIVGREILLYPYEIGSAVEYIKNGNNVLDISILADTDKIHIAYISSFRGRVGVYYKCKEEEVSKASTVYEGRFVSDVMLMKKGSNISILWSTNRGIFDCLCDGIFNNIRNVYSGSRGIVKCSYTCSDESVFSNELYGNLFDRECIPTIFDTLSATESKTCEDSKNIDYLIIENNKKDTEILNLRRELNSITEKYSKLVVENKNQAKIIEGCERDIDILKRENYQLNSIIEDIKYKE